MATTETNKMYRQEFIEKWGVNPGAMLSFARKIGISSLKGTSDETRGLIMEAYREEKDFEGTHGVRRTVFDSWLKQAHPGASRKYMTIEQVYEKVGEYKERVMLKESPKTMVWATLKCLINGHDMDEEQEALYDFLLEEENG